MHLKGACCLAQIVSTIPLQPSLSSLFEWAITFFHLDLPSLRLLYLCFLVIPGYLKMYEFTIGEVAGAINTGLLFCTHLSTYSCLSQADC
jgi:hypothetical protein